MSDLLQIALDPNWRPPQNDGYPELCARPGYGYVTHCIGEPGHEGQHTYSPIPDGRCQCGREWTPQR